jgi:hypothetical protein
MAVTEGAVIAEPDAIKFHRLFLALLQRMGRMHEASLMAIYLLWTLDFMDYMGTATKMFAKRKVPLMPHRVKAHGDVKRIFEATRTES